MISFDSTLVKSDKKFEINQEVEVLDGEKCFQRGVVIEIKKDSLKIDLKYKQLTLNIKYV